MKTIVLAAISLLASCAEVGSVEDAASPCTIVRYLGAGGKVVEVRAKEDSAVVASIIEKEFWEMKPRLSPSKVEFWRKLYGDELRDHSDERIAEAVWQDHHSHMDRDEFIADAISEETHKVRRSGNDLVLIGGKTYLPRGGEILALEGCSD
ncbi:MAG: hypothetical protein OXH52_20540 [Gammaproteobacteria bacterium]|nr:hypothetical protein [Gammaproteobacteria bacterium]